MPTKNPLYGWFSHIIKESPDGSDPLRHKSLPAQTKEFLYKIKSYTQTYTDHVRSTTDSYRNFILPFDNKFRAELYLLINADRREDDKINLDSNSKYMSHITIPEHYDFVAPNSDSDYLFTQLHITLNFSYQDRAYSFKLYISDAGFIVGVDCRDYSLKGYQNYLWNDLDREIANKAKSLGTEIFAKLYDSEVFTGLSVLINDCLNEMRSSPYYRENHKPSGKDHKHLDGILFDTIFTLPAYKLDAYYQKYVDYYLAVLQLHKDKSLSKDLLQHIYETKDTYIPFPQEFADAMDVGGVTNLLSAIKKDIIALALRLPNEAHTPEQRQEEIEALLNIYEQDCGYTPDQDFAKAGPKKKR